MKIRKSVITIVGELIDDLKSKWQTWVCDKRLVFRLRNAIPSVRDIPTIACDSGNGMLSFIIFDRGVPPAKNYFLYRKSRTGCLGSVTGSDRILLKPAPTDDPE
jgi:hypothetical protein